MSYFKGVGNGSNSYGQFWFGGSNFPAFYTKRTPASVAEKILNMVSSAINPLHYGILIHLVPV